MTSVWPNAVANYQGALKQSESLYDLMAREFKLDCELLQKQVSFG